MWVAIFSAGILAVVISSTAVSTWAGVESLEPTTVISL